MRASRRTLKTHGARAAENAADRVAAAFRPAVARGMSAGAAERRERAIELLRASATRVTSGRVAIIDLLLRRRESLSASDILSGLGAAAPDRVTVYRCLASLAHAGIVQEVLSLDKVRRYGLERSGADLQVRFRCAGCGQVISRVASFAVPGAPTGFVVTGQVFSVDGLCSDCA
jgi:Fe2+ or Zn2+ uptake regulation protein